MQKEEQIGVPRGKNLGFVVFLGRGCHLEAQ